MSLQRLLLKIGSVFFLTTLAFATVLVLSPLVTNIDDPRVFELDGNAIQDLGKGGDDWSTTCVITDATTGANTCAPDIVLTRAVAFTTPQAGAPFEVTAGWPYVIRDQALMTAVGGCAAGTDPDTFGGGSKDTLDINQNTYLCGQVQAKSDIQHAYAAAYQVKNVDGTNHTYVYFGTDVLSKNGDGSTGIWFLQSPISVTNVTSSKTKFVGNHQEGDLFVVSPFTIGGGTSTINVYYWHNGALTLFPTVGNDNAALCNAVTTSPFGSQPLVCAIANQANAIAPWPYQGVISGGIAPGLFPPNAFVEGGLDLTGLFKLLGTPQPCFSTAMFETRSSQSLTATLEDFVLANFQLCSISAGKTCTVPNGSTPQILSENGGTFVRYPFNITVTNTGPGEVYNPKVTDQFPSDAINIMLGGTSFSTTTVGPVAVPLNANGCTSADGNGLQTGECAAITGTFDVPSNADRVNKISNATAAPNSGGSPSVIAPGLPISETFGPDSDNSSCHVSTSPKLSLNKSCTVGLVPTGSGVVLQLQDTITVCNVSTDTSTSISNISINNDLSAVGLSSTNSIASSLSLPNASTCAAGVACNCQTYKPNYTPTTCVGGVTATGGRCFFDDTVSLSSVPTDEFGGSLSGAELPGSVQANGGLGCSVCPGGACNGTTGP